MAQLNFFCSDKIADKKFEIEYRLRNHIVLKTLSTIVFQSEPESNDYNHKSTLQLQSLRFKRLKLQTQ